MGIERVLVLLFAFFASALASSIAHAQTASALVLEKSGASVPNVQAYSEVPVGTKVSLSDRARLVFLHYFTCRTVTVVGGTIAFGVEKYTLTGGKKEAETRSSCPRQVALKSGGEMAGIMLRSAPLGAIPQMLVRPSFVLVGRRAEDFAAVRVSEDDKRLLEVPLEGRRFQWPADAAPLSPEMDYELVLIPKVSGTPPVKTRFFVSSFAAEGTAGIVLINVE